MNKRITIALSVLLLVTSNIYAFAYTPSKKIVKLVGSTQTYMAPDVTEVKDTVYVDGKKLELSVPLLKGGGRTYLPMREIGNALGKNVEWDGYNKIAAYMENSEILLEVPANHNQAVVKSETIVNIDNSSPETVGFIQGGRTYLPQRFVAEQLGYQVDYFANNGSAEIHLTSPGKTRPTAPLKPVTKPTTQPSTKPNTSDKVTGDGQGTSLNLDSLKDYDVDKHGGSGTNPDGTANSHGAGDSLIRPRK